MQTLIPVLVGAGSVLGAWLLASWLEAPDPDLADPLLAMLVIVAGGAVAAAYRTTARSYFGVVGGGLVPALAWGGLYLVTKSPSGLGRAVLLVAWVGVPVLLSAGWLPLAAIRGVVRAIRHDRQLDATRQSWQAGRGGRFREP